MNEHWTPARRNFQANVMRQNIKKNKERAAKDASFKRRMIEKKSHSNNAIARFRKSLNLDQPEFAKLVGVAQQTVRDWEAGRKNVGVKNRQKLDIIAQENVVEKINWEVL